MNANTKLSPLPLSTPSSPADVVVLCGGKGTRLQSVVADRPKPMADVNGRPFLDLLIEEASSRGLERFILCAGHMAGYIRDYYASRKDYEILVSEEPAPLGTAGALKLCWPLLSGGTVLVLNGDSFCAADLEGVLAFHRSKGARATVVTADAPERTDGGNVASSGGGEVIAFEEKSGTTAGRRVNAGIYALEPSVLEAIPAGKACSLEREILPGLIGKGLYAFAAPEPLYDIGTPERLERFRAAWGN